MPCPDCGAEDRLCVKNGFALRKTAIDPSNKMGAKVRRYICTECGYIGRGNFFKLPEYDVPEEDTTCEENPVDPSLRDPKVFYCDD